MNELTKMLTKHQIEQASIEELKHELSRTLKVTSQYLVYMSMIWSQLNKMGVDLSGLKSGLFEYVPLIATNKLNPDLVIEFAGNKTLLAALANVPIEQQNWIAETKQVAFVDLGEKNEKIERVLDLTKAKPREIYQVFGGENGFRNPDQQYLYLKAKSKVPKIPKTKERKTLRSVEFDLNNEYMLVGKDSRVKVDTILKALGDLYEIDMYEIMSKYSNRIAKK